MTVLVYQSLFEVPRPIQQVPQGTEWSPQPTPLKQPNFARAAQIATGVAWVPYNINNAAVQEPLGFETAPQPTPLRQPLFKNAAQVATGLYWIPYNINNTAASLPLIGWSVVNENPPAFRRYQALPEWSGRIDLPQQQQPWGWTVAIPELPQFIRRQAFPEYASGRIDLPAQQQPWGWSVDMQDLPVKPTHIEGVLAGTDLPPETIQQSPIRGWSVIIPDFPQAVKRQALPELSLRIDQPAAGPAVVQPYGWQLVISVDLPAPHHFTVAGVDLPPQPIQPYSSGWNIVTPDLPQFVRRQAMPEYMWRISFAPQQPWGWSVVLPELPAAPRHLEATLTGLDLPPEPISTQPWGWSIVASDLNQFIRRQAFPEYTWRLDFTTTQQQQQPWGWSVTLPEGFARRGKVLTGLDLPVRPVLVQPYGWSVTSLELPRFARKEALPEFTWRIDFVSVVVSVQPYGWSVTINDLIPRRGKPLTGADLPPSPVPPQRPDGWFINFPDLPAFRRYQALPEYTSRIDRPPITPPTVVFAGWLGQDILVKNVVTARGGINPNGLDIFPSIIIPPAPPPFTTPNGRWLSRVIQYGSLFNIYPDEPVPLLNEIGFTVYICAPGVISFKDTNLVFVKPSGAMLTTPTAITYSAVVPATAFGWPVLIYTFGRGDLSEVGKWSVYVARGNMPLSPTTTFNVVS